MCAVKISCAYAALGDQPGEDVGARVGGKRKGATITVLAVAQTVSSSDGIIAEPTSDNAVGGGTRVISFGVDKTHASGQVRLVAAAHRPGAQSLHGGGSVRI